MWPTMKGWTNTEYAQAIFTATRGPDNRGPDSDMLKSLTTARVRACISDWSYGNIRLNRLGPLEIELRDRLMRTASLHFVCHYEEAVKAIESVCHYSLETEQMMP